MAKLIPLDSLTMGQRFHEPVGDRTGTLLRVGLMGCTVRYDGSQHKTIHTKENGDVDFDAPGRKVEIACSTAVYPLAQDENPTRKETKMTAPQNGFTPSVPAPKPGKKAPAPATNGAKPKAARKVKTVSVVVRPVKAVKPAKEPKAKKPAKAEKPAKGKKPVKAEGVSGIIKWGRPIEDYFTMSDAELLKIGKARPTDWTSLYRVAARAGNKGMEARLRGIMEKAGLGSKRKGAK
jgi:hypothetical protein